MITYEELAAGLEDAWLMAGLHEHLFAESGMVAIRWISSGTHRGEFLGAAPTGKRVLVDGISILQVDRGKISEVFTNWDTLSLMRQIGEPKIAD